MAVAEAAGRNSEFQTAMPPAARAPGNSLQVLSAATIWNRGKPTASAQSSNVPTPQDQLQPGPSWRRKVTGATGPSTRGQAKSRRANHASNSTGASTSGQLSLRAPSESNEVLNLTQRTSGKTCTCKSVGIAKLFSASTK